MGVRKHIARLTSEEREHLTGRAGPAGKVQL